MTFLLSFDVELGSLEEGSGTRFECSYEGCCGTTRKKVGGVFCFSCGIILIVLMSIPGGIVLFIEPTFGDVTDVSGLSLTPGFGSLTVTVSSHLSAFTYSFLR